MIIKTYIIPPYYVIVHKVDTWFATLYIDNTFIRRESWTQTERRMVDEYIQKAKGLQEPKVKP